MTRIPGAAPAFALLLAALPATAQDTAPDAGRDGINLMEEGARLLFEGLLDQMEPRLRELEGMTEEMARQLEPTIEFLSTEIGPAFMALVARIDDLANYQAPEFLENGDIIIRRKPDAPPFVPLPEKDDPAAPADPDGIEL
jgi:hypothetical protein